MNGPSTTGPKGRSVNYGAEEIDPPLAHVALATHHESIRQYPVLWDFVGNGPWSPFPIN